MFKRAIVSTSAAIIVLSVLAVSLLLSPAADSCSVANAQEDNPCLSQDATISAYRLFEMDAQSTITALEAEVATLTAENMPGPFEPFRDDFNNNDRGWAVGATAEGAVEIRNGSLQISPSEARSILLFLPDFEVEGDFYIEMLVLDRGGSTYEFGFWHGDFASNRYYTFVDSYQVTGPSISGSVAGTVFYENLTIIASTENQRAGDGDTIALERIDGIYNYYVNDRLQLSHSATPLGTQLAIYAYDDLVEIDYVVVRESR